MKLYILGVLLLLSQVGVAWISQFFLFDTGYTDRPILEFVGLELIASLFFVFAVEELRRNSERPIGFILTIGVLCRVFMLSSEFIQETDAYRYLWDGEVSVAGMNPYAKSPQQMNKAGVFSEQKDLYRKINHPEYKTIYPPVAQMVFTLAQKLTPWSFWGLRILTFLAEMLILWFLIRSLTLMGRPSSWILVYAWCPLLIKEYSNSLHVDVFAVLFLAATIYFLLRGFVHRAFIFLGLSVLVKWFSLVLVPMVFVYFWRRERPRSYRGALVFALTVLVCFAPFASAGGALFESLFAFSKEWRVNSSIYAVIFNLWWELTDWPFKTVNLLSRVTASTIFLGAYAAVFWRFFRSPEPESFLRAGLLVIATLFFTAPTGNPWYFGWLFPFLVFLPWRSLVLYSGLAFSYYVTFYFMYHDRPDNFNYVQSASYLLFYLSLLWEWRTRRSPSNE